MNTLLVVTIVTMLVVVAIELILKKWFDNKVTSAFMHNNPDELIDIANSKLARFLIPPYNRDYMKLSAYMLKEDEKKTHETLKILMSTKTNAPQRVDLLAKAFGLYMDKKDYKQAKACVDELETFRDNKAVAKNVAMILPNLSETYEVFAEKNTSFIEKYEQELESAPAARKLQLSYLLSEMYKNKKDYEASDKYQKMMKEIADGVLNPQAKDAEAK